MGEYEKFIYSKQQLGNMHGFKPLFMPDFLKDFQMELVDYSINQGRSAIFTDCGLGKSPMSLVWAENVARHTGRNVLILTTCAVAPQFVQEGAKFGIEVTRSHHGEVGRITACNYERLHLRNPADFAGVVCDESSILKNFKGKTRLEITIFMRKIKYRLLATATPSPNDFPELGTSSEVLGYMGHMDMLNKFFKNDLNNSASGRMRGEVIKWRLKGHAELPFWRWVCSWGRAIRKPSDLGFDDGRFTLPPLIEREHIVQSRTSPEGALFALPAHGLAEQRDERKRTVQERCERMADIANGTTEPVLLWCHLNDEGNLLQKLVPDAVQVSGSDSDDRKEDRLLGFAEGRYRVLITKPKIGAWGLNYQHCAKQVYFPSHSFEQYYQAIRRCWRFGQTRPVEVDIIASEGEVGILSNLQRKADQADKMFSSLVSEMNNAISINRINEGQSQMTLPTWL